MKKIFILILPLIIYPLETIESCGKSTESTYSPVSLSQSTLSFTPDIYIKKKLPQDLELEKIMRPLFFETDKTANPQEKVYQDAIRKYGGLEIVLLTEDNFRISSLFFKQPQAQLNIIYVTGYFFDQTPTKEWCAPLVPLFSKSDMSPKFNIFCFDWRGFGQSNGQHSLFCHNSFGKNAYPDIQAAIDFIRQDNDKPIVLVGFCLGAAMAIHATIEAEKAGKSTADALVLNSIFDYFENQFENARKAENRCSFQLLITLYGNYFAENMVAGSLFDVNPIDMIKEIKIPCYFEHYTYDPFATIDMGIKVFQAATCPKIFMQSDVGRHVRIHTKAPYQYRSAFLKVLKIFGLIKDK